MIYFCQIHTQMCTGLLIDLASGCHLGTVVKVERTPIHALGPPSRSPLQSQSTTIINNTTTTITIKAITNNKLSCHHLVECTAIDPEHDGIAASVG